MKVDLMTDPFHMIIIDQLYDPEELELIWEEMDTLRNYFIDGNQVTNPARSKKDFKSLKKNTGILLDRHFLNRRDDSKILKLNRKIFRPDIINQPESWFFDGLNCSLDYTVLSYYENSDYYKCHKDSANVTCLTWLYREPKMFRGGDIKFPKYNVNVEIANNACIMFPSQIHHSVDQVKMDNEHLGKGLGRHVIVQFLNQATNV